MEHTVRTKNVAFSTNVIFLVANGSCQQVVDFTGMSKLAVRTGSIRSATTTIKIHNVSEELNHGEMETILIKLGVTVSDVTKMTPLLPVNGYDLLTLTGRNNIFFCDGIN